MSKQVYGGSYCRRRSNFTKYLCRLDMYLQFSRLIQTHTVSKHRDVFW